MRVVITQLDKKKKKQEVRRPRSALSQVNPDVLHASNVGVLFQHVGGDFVHSGRRRPENVQQELVDLSRQLTTVRQKPNRRRRNVSTGRGHAAPLSFSECEVEE
ncbi:hypothetical protein MTO96_006458 [Rhipicephalus appendiculatus]